MFQPIDLCRNVVTARIECLVPVGCLQPAARFKPHRVGQRSLRYPTHERARLAPSQELFLGDRKAEIDKPFVHHWIALVYAVRSE